MKDMKPKIYVAAYDCHFPKIDKPTLAAILDFLDSNKVDGFIFGGDQLDLECISHHNKNKPLYRTRAAYKQDINGFREKVLEPVEARLKKGAEKTWIIGNHERWEHDLVETNPELEGLADHVALLDLEAKGWKIVPLGHAHSLGKLKVIHGEVLTGIGNQAGMYPSRKAVQIYAQNILAGHTHSPQTFTQISPVEMKKKWQGTIAPIVGAVNPSYLRNRPTAWLNGFCIVEVLPSNNFNLYSVIVTNGQFSYGGKIYGKKK